LFQYQSSGGRFPNLLTPGGLFPEKLLDFHDISRIGNKVQKHVRNSCDAPDQFLKIKRGV